MSALSQKEPGKIEMRRKNKIDRLEYWTWRRANPGKNNIDRMLELEEREKFRSRLRYPLGVPFHWPSFLVGLAAGPVFLVILIWMLVSMVTHKEIRTPDSFGWGNALGADDFNSGDEGGQ